MGQKNMIFLNLIWDKTATLRPVWCHLFLTALYGEREIIDFRHRGDEITILAILGCRGGHSGSNIFRDPDTIADARAPTAVSAGRPGHAWAHFDVFLCCTCYFLLGSDQKTKNQFLKSKWLKTDRRHQCFKNWLINFQNNYCAFFQSVFKTRWVQPENRPWPLTLG